MISIFIFQRNISKITFLLAFIFVIPHFDLNAQDQNTIEVRGKIVDNRAKEI